MCQTTHTLRRSNMYNHTTINNTKHTNKESSMYTVTVLDYDDNRDYYFGKVGKTLNNMILGGKKAIEAKRIKKNKKMWKKNNPNIIRCI